MAPVLVGEEKLGAALQRLAQLALEAIDSADLAGITLPGDGRARTVGYTHPAAAAIDDAQHDTGGGPCLDALRTNQIFRVDSTDDDARWPGFSQAAFDHGVHSVLSLPLAVNDHAVGALNLYAFRRGAFGPSDERQAVAFVEQAAVVLSNAEESTPATGLSPQMRRALASRAVIDKARRILMRTRSCTAEEAFQLLVQASRHSNSTLRDAAHQVVRRARHRQM